MKRNVVSFRSNANLARQLWGEPSRIALRSLKDLTLRYSLSVAAGDLQFLQGRWYVTHSGLLQLASPKGCRGIKTILQERLSDGGTGRWVFKATVFKSLSSKGFVGYRHAHQLPFQVENFILNVKREHTTWGARKIRERLIRRFSGIKIPAKSSDDNCTARGDSRLNNTQGSLN